MDVDKVDTGHGGASDDMSSSKSDSSQTLNEQSKVSWKKWVREFPFHIWLLSQTVSLMTWP